MGLGHVFGMIKVSEPLRRRPALRRSGAQVVGPDQVTLRGLVPWRHRTVFAGEWATPALPSTYAGPGAGGHRSDWARSAESCGISVVMLR